MFILTFQRSFVSHPIICVSIAPNILEEFIRGDINF